MAPCTEIALIPLKAGKYPDVDSEAGQTLRELSDHLLQQDGAQRVYWGRQVEEPSLLLFFVDWDSVDHHKNFMNAPAYKPFIEKWGIIMDGNPTLYHAELSPHPPSTALSSNSSPVTEVLLVHFPTDLSDSSKSEWEAGIKNFIEVVDKNAENSTGSARGWMVEEIEIPDKPEKTKAYLVVIGWTSVEAHMQFRSTQAFKDSIHLIRGAKDLITLKGVHVSCKEIRRDELEVGTEVTEER